MKKIMNVIIYYDNYDEVYKYMKEVNSIAFGLVDIVLVVNKDTYCQVPKIVEFWRQQEYDNLKVFNFTENVGYLNALLNTIQMIDLNNYKYFILSNTDIQYVSKDFFQKLMEKSYIENIGCIAPSVYAVNSNSYSNPHYKQRIPLQKINRLIWIFSHPKCAQFYLWLSGKKSSNIKKKEEPSCYVYSPNGCYMIFSQEFIKKIYGYKYGVKMYSEESCIGELLVRSQKKCFYDNSIKVNHVESTVTGKINKKLKYHYFAESLKYIKDEFYT